jgi:hypothetical protein
VLRTSCLYSFLLLGVLTNKLFIMKVQGTVVSVSNTVKTANSENASEYRTCVVKLADGNNYFAKIWEKSFQRGVEIGAEYTVEGQQDGDNIWLTVLNGADAQVATIANLGALFGVAQNTLAEEPLF